MILVVLSVVVIALLVAVLAVYLFILGMQLNRTANNLEECLTSLQSIGRHASAIGPGVMRLNQIGKELAGALPLLYEGAESLIAKKSAPAADEPTPAGVGYLDLVPVASRGNIGYLDS